ncbi:5-guanidino-2-oxopentanoate decarboxylase [Roseovarius rhodophyticola]|uniref:5-guanidino-2-oxopentanoate decarboxylase n=1 Tax=Roseovarius rhodophyticola TaxID=3080827 RepID=A0ABZ2THA0_9RHOB|nr:5-guanidino-2-oxopentanoate decarboxylase [Roseovarius sp. W115]MDV2928738.1 5-guanidino-2-oxopentanoate decarboxylase [Roseovarius sp. W115]
MTQRPLGAQISHMLKARGVDVIFGIPGVHNVEMYRGIEEAGITHILARHEQGAGFMADGYARASGKPGVAYVITGPGLTNIMTPMGQAYSDSVPLLVISSCLDETAAKRGQLHQMIDQEGAAACVCDWSHEVKSAEVAYALIDRAFNEFATARPRPKHIQVPIAIGGSTVEAAPDRPATSLARPMAQPDEILSTAKALTSAKRPLILFGGGAKAGAGVATELARRSGSATMMSYAGRGVVDPSYELDLGAFLARPDSAKAFAQADLVLVIGSELAEVDLWRTELGHKGQLIRVDIDPTELDHPAAERSIVADAAAFLENLLHALPESNKTDWVPDEIAAHKARWRAETDAERPGIVAVADALRAAIPDDTMIYSDMTQFAYVAKEVWPMSRPGHWHHPFGYGTLGYGMPAAIGGAIARQGKPTLAICGDSGFQYTLQELGTAVEHGLPLPIILWDNGKLKEIEDSMIRSQIAPNAVIARNPDFVALAKAYGAHAESPKTLDEMGQAARKAFEADRPTLIHVKAGLKG